MKKNLLCILLALAMLLSLTACGGTAASSEPETAASSVSDAGSAEMASEIAEPQAAPEVSQDIVETSSLEFDDTYELELGSSVVYPLTEETMTLTYFTSPLSNLSSYLESYNDHMLLGDIQEKIGIDLEFYEVSASAASDQFNLMVAGGDLCDYMPVNRYYSGGLSKAYEEEVIIDVMPYLEEWAPDYLSVISAAGSTLKDLTTDNGEMLHFCTINTVYMPISGLSIRQDWLDALNMDVPKTTEELLDVLRAFHSTYGCESTFMIDSDGLLKEVYGSFGAEALPLELGMFASEGAEIAAYQIDGAVYSGLQSDGYREYLEYLSTLYREGLIADDFFVGSGGMMVDTNAEKANGDYGIWWANADDYSVIEDLSEDPNINIQGIAPIVKNEGDEYHFGESHSYLGMEDCSITTACAEPELAAAFINWFYTDEGFILGSFGTEHLSFEYNDAGEPELTDIVLSNPDGMGTNIAANYYTFGFVPTYLKTERLYGGYLQKELDAMYLWRDTVLADYNLPAVSLTNEESVSYAAKATDIYTTATEAVLRFIVGEQELNDANWDEFQNTLTTMGIDDCIEIYQAAMDRYADR